MTPYSPQPLNTSQIELPATLLELLEQLAENVHEVWAFERMKDGWTWGPQRDDDNKCHPCLVPFGKLPEGEKEYDRKMAAEALKAVVALGYTIERRHV